MARPIIFPKQGLQMTEGTITRWLKREGEFVRRGEPLFEMETDKLTIAIDAAEEGALLKILRPAGDVVPVAEAIAYVGEPGEEIPAAPAPSPAGTPPAAPPPAPGRTPVTPRARMRAGELGVAAEALAGSGPDGLVIERDVLAAAEIKATPLARAEARLAGVELDGLAGSGARGKVVAADVRAAAARAGEQRRETVVPLAGARGVIARRMKESLSEMAQANHRMQVDMTQACLAREQLAALGRKVSYNDLALLCAARALAEFPQINASLSDQRIVQKHYVNVGMAVAAEGGLLVPVIRDADRMTLLEIARAAADLGARAKAGSLLPGECSGGTFTVTNLGMFGVDSFTAIVNPPEAAILAVGAVKKQPVVVEGDAIVARPMMWLSLTYDHRVVDGAPAARFLRRVKELLEHPALLM